MLLRHYTWKDYGITKDRKIELKVLARLKENKNAVELAAYRTDALIAQWMIKSVTKGKSYDDIQVDTDLGTIPCGRTDFYGYRRLFFYYFDLILREG